MPLGVSPGSRHRFIVVVAGELTVTAPNRAPITAGESQVIVIPDVVGVRLHSCVNTSRYEFTGPLDDALYVHPMWRISPTALDVPTALLRPFTTLANAVLEASAKFGLGSSVSRPFGESLERSTDAIMSYLRGPMLTELTERQADLVARAAATAARRAADSSFGVQELADELEVSRVYLHRVLTKLGVRPLAFMRAVREDLDYAAPGRASSSTRCTA